MFFGASTLALCALTLGVRWGSFGGPSGVGAAATSLKNRRLVLCNVGATSSLHTFDAALLLLGQWAFFIASLHSPFGILPPYYYSILLHFVPICLYGTSQPLSEHSVTA